LTQKYQKVKTAWNFTRNPKPCKTPRPKTRCSVPQTRIA